jgi:membrane-bound lytic murein transglycosylase D
VVPQTITPAVLRPVVPGDIWKQLRGRFVMTDCDADPAVLAWAERYTKSPEQFEDALRDAMPQLAYVQEVAAQYDIPGEFVLLPWIESTFQSLPGRKNRPAGMWQIMPLTASRMGLRVDNRYDARLDVDASANAVMKLLKHYHEQFGDWRLVDYAFNTGEFKIAKMVRKYGLPPPTPFLPKWPIRRGAKEHLTKLLAMACVVRDPDRFNVALPTLPRDQHLVQVSISHSMPIAQAADQAGISVGSLKDINAAFRNSTIDAGASSYLMLPADHVQQFQDAVQDKLDESSSTAPAGQGLADAPDSLATAAPAAPPALEKTHTVKAGESLWLIAHHYSTSPAELQRWNHLRSPTIKPGQVLKVSEAD